jgi:hypothetical protein
MVTLIPTFPINILHQHTWTSNRGAPSNHLQPTEGGGECPKIAVASKAAISQRTGIGGKILSGHCHSFPTSSGQPNYNSRRFANHDDKISGEGSGTLNPNGLSRYHVYTTDLAVTGSSEDGIYGRGKVHRCRGVLECAEKGVFRNLEYRVRRC